MGVERQPKSISVHFSLKIWHLVATILIIFPVFLEKKQNVSSKKHLIFDHISGAYKPIFKIIHCHIFKDILYVYVIRFPSDLKYITSPPCET